MKSNIKQINEEMFQLQREMNYAQMTGQFHRLEELDKLWWKLDKLRYRS